MLDEAGQVIDVIHDAIVAVADPVALAVSAQVVGVNVVAVGEAGGDILPAMLLVAATMHKEERRIGRIAP